MTKIRFPYDASRSDIDISKLPQEIQGNLVGFLAQFGIEAEYWAGELWVDGGSATYLNAHDVIKAFIAGYAFGKGTTWSIDVLPFVQA